MSDRYGQEEFRARWVEEECRGKSFPNFGPEVLGKVVVSYVDVLVFASCGIPKCICCQDSQKSDFSEFPDFRFVPGSSAKKSELRGHQMAMRDDFGQKNPS